MHRHAIRIGSGPSACYENDGICDSTSPIVRLSVSNLYDCLVRSYKESIEDAQLLVDTLHSLGFGIHPDKCSIPSQSAEFLGTQPMSKERAETHVSHCPPNSPCAHSVMVVIMFIVAQATAFQAKLFHCEE